MKLLSYTAVLGCVAVSVAACSSGGSSNGGSGASGGSGATDGASGAGGSSGASGAGGTSGASGAGGTGGSAGLDGGTDAPDAGTPCTGEPLSHVVSWWRGNGFLDALGLNPGTNGGAAALTANTPIGSAFSLSGASGSFIDVADSSSLDFTTAVTLEGWINPNVLGGRIIDKVAAGGTDGYLLDTNAGKLRMIVGSASAVSSANLVAHQWTHVAGTYDGSNLRVYIDGAESGVTASSGPIPTNAHPFRIGGDVKGNSRFDGELDEIRVFDAALSGAEVKKLYLAGLAKKSGVAWWSGEYDYDDSFGSNDGAPAGAVVAFSSGTVGQAFKLNGTSYVEVPDSASLDVTSAVTLEAWVTQDVANGRIIDKIAAGGTNGYLLDISGGKLRLLLGSTSLVSTESLPVGVPTHVAGTFSVASGTMTLYINGVPAGSKASSTPIPTNTLPLRLGAAANGSNRLTGMIDEARIFSRELSASEILDLYQEIRCP